MFFDLSFLTTSLLCFIVSVAIYIWHKKYYNHYWKNKGIGYEKPSTYFGLIPFLFSKKAVHEIELEAYKKHDKVFGHYEFATPVLMVSDLELLKAILVKDFHIFNGRRDFGVSQEPFDSFLSFIKGGEKWKRIRSIMSPAFTSGKLRGMMSGIGKSADALSTNMLKAGEDGKTVECRSMIANFVMDAIAKVAFATDLDTYNDPNSTFLVNARKTFSFNISWQLILFMICPNLAVKLGFSFGPFDYFVELIKKIIEQRKKSDEVHNDFLQMMLDHLEDSENSNQESKDSNRKVLSMEELVAQCLIFLLGGFDNTSSAIALTLLNIVTNPEVEEKVLEDVDNFWKSKTDIDAATAGESRYLEACISETLRMYPPATRIERLASEDYVLGDTGVTIPKGMIVIVPVYGIQHDEEYFPEPDKFLPERFLPENSDNLSTFANLPFGSGPRNCIAMRFVLIEIKLCLLHLFRDITFSVCPETKNPPEFDKSALLKPKEVLLKISKRVK